ncbi:MAG: hypothetical protein R3F29_11950 [Planctomycetota bacterium]
MAKTQTAASHRWSFYRAGGVDQVRLDKGADILNLDKLDKKLWVALSCPVKGLEIDTRMLELIDADGDGQVRPPELLGAVAWLRDVLQNADDLAKGVDGVALANIRKDTDEGKAVFAAAAHALKTLGAADKVLTVADSVKIAAEFGKERLNGDGVVPPESVVDEKARAVAADLVACMGGVADRSGEVGYDQSQLDAFFAACAAYDAWHKEGEAAKKDVMPFGADTPAAHASFTALRAKIDDYFGRCRLASFDPRALAAVNREEAAYIAAAAKDLTITADEMAHFPLSLVEAGKPLDLEKGVNPAWAAQVATFRKLKVAARRRSGRGWVCGARAQFAGYEAWLRPEGREVEKLGVARVREILAGKKDVAAGDRRRPGAGRRVRGDDQGREAGAAAPRLRSVAQQLHQLHRLLFAQGRDLPGRDAVPRRAPRPVLPRQRRRQARHVGADGQDLPRLLRLHAAGRAEDAGGVRVHCR